MIKFKYNLPIMLLVVSAALTNFTSHAQYQANQDLTGSNQTLDVNNDEDLANNSANNSEEEINPEEEPEESPDLIDQNREPDLTRP